MDKKAVRERPHSSESQLTERRPHVEHQSRPIKSDYGIHSRGNTLEVGVDQSTSRKSSPRKILIPSISFDSAESPFNSKLKRKRYQRFNSVPPDNQLEETEISDFAEKAQFVTDQIHRLAKAFVDRAESVRYKLTQPPTPSTDGSKKGWFYINWLAIVSTAFTYNCWCIPYRICFMEANQKFLFTWMFLDYLCDAIYLSDIILFKSRMRFLRDGHWVEERREMMVNYVRSTSFKVDLLCILPLDLLYLVFGVNAVFLRIFRMFKIGSYWKLFERLDLVLASPFLVRVGKTLLYMMFLIHINACAYYALSVYEGIASTDFVLQTRKSEYLRCFYFALKTATKIGKNKPPENDQEYTFMIFNWIIGVFACAALIGQIRDIITAKERNETQYRELLDRVTVYMHRIHLPPTLQDKVKLWFTFNWQQQKSLEEGSALKFLPIKLRTDVALDVHVHTLSKVQLFHDCDPAILRELVLKLKPVLILPGDYVCKKGEVGREMYIVQTGQLEVMGGPDGNTVLVTLHEGSVFGEISLLAIGGGNRRTADVRSKGFSNLFVLNKKDLYEAIRDYPETQQILQKKALKVMKESAAKEKKLLEEAEASVIISSRKSTPRFLEAVLKILPEDSGASKLLRYGSHVTLAPSYPSRSVINSPNPIRAVSPLGASSSDPVLNMKFSDSNGIDDDEIIVIESDKVDLQEQAVFQLQSDHTESSRKSSGAERRRCAFAALFQHNRVRPLEKESTPHISLESRINDEVTVVTSFES